jgi:GlcNAc-P-P-Und epimerase
VANQSKHKYLVTGGSGFIGTNLITYLLSLGQEVINLDVAPPLILSHRALWKETSILDLAGLVKCFGETNPSVVVHLAARTDLNGADEHAYAANTTGVANLLHAVCSVGTVRRLIVASSMLVCQLGYQPKHDTDYCPTTLYGKSKVKTEQLIHAAPDLPPWTLIRPTTIWGPWHLRLRDEFLARIKSGVYLHPRSDCRRSYGYVENVAYQILRLSELPEDQVAGKTFYVGDAPIRLSDYVDGFSLRLRHQPVRRLPLSVFKSAAWLGDMVAALGWRSVPLTSYRLSNMTRDNILDLSPTLSLTGPGPFTLLEGVERTCAWYAEFNQTTKGIT